MDAILIPVLIVSVIGLIGGLGLAIASIVMAVPVDEKAEAIQEVLPGANCGACGYSGCAGYAKALSEATTTETTLCAPGGTEVAQQIGDILGLESGTIRPMTAVVRCKGTIDHTQLKHIYDGIDSCKMANQLFGGPWQCKKGCLAYGDCVRVCPYDAISVCNGAAIINPEKCRACKMCIAACPKNLIELMPKDTLYAAVLCQNTEKGAVTRKQCDVGCIGCMRCVKVCEFDAIKVEDNLATIDYEKCTGCGKCLEVCAPKCIHLTQVTQAAQ